MFVSYAQNFEDVMLWRALGRLDRGFYIDVGAYDPTIHSVTRSFYERDWHGINIEPVKSYFDKIAAERPEDVNLCVAVSDTNGVTDFFNIQDTGLSTTDPDIKELHRTAGHEIDILQTKTQTLASICEKYVDSQIHFLKIDVEGSERNVLLGMDFDRWRPWILLIEATKPMSQQPNYAAWEDLVLGSGYVFAYSDGLNRFYVAKEHPELLAAFESPPNVFDDFVLGAQHQAQQRVLEAEAQIVREQQAAAACQALATRAEAKASETQRRVDALEVSLARAEAEANRARLRAAIAEDACTQARANLRFAERRAQSASGRLAEREAFLEATYRSRSWRLTAPFRALGNAVRRRRIRRYRPLPRLQGKPPAPTLFIECTHTYHSDLNTGIQRVVRNVLRNAAVSAARYGYVVVPVVLENDQFISVDVDRVLADKSRLARPDAGATANAPGTSRGFTQRVWRLLLKIVSRVLPSARAQRFLFAQPDRFGMAWCVLLPARALGLRPWPTRVPETSGLVNLDRYARCDGSILVLLDSSWTIPIWPAVERFKRSGGKVVGVIYDLIPITHPHTAVLELTVAFKAWLQEHIRHSEAFIGISRSTADLVAQFIATLADQERAHNRPAAIDYFHLGSELDLIEQAEEPRPAIKRMFDAKCHTFLMVGSIEPRKNHSYVLDAFDAYWESGGDAALIMLGRQAWKTDAFLQRVAGHKQLHRRLFLVRDATDAELDYAYRGASALIIASEIEGFGLPVAEAFQRGLPVMCSDIPVFREIAEGKATFFDLSRSDRLTATLVEFCRSHDVAERGVRTPQKWLTWRESTDQLCAAIMRALAPEAASRAPAPGV